ncbi:CoxG family protein [Rhizorhapis sp. SPR117]|uniref:CoxG family protein n=1 Tax=Rhizorhapis sp. SPR117 TaxID=2912611 RepID=UPI001F272FCF|nr:carbon monoxide dehydrogenase subunit G [Rhizorhapis sp. SPR117]
MQMTGEQRIDAPIEVVWRGLNDPEILKACIPGCQTLEVIGENRFRASATIKVGPISARFGGEVQLSELDPPRSYRITGEGSGGVAGAAKGGARVILVEAGSETILHYEVDAEVNGRLAQLGGKLIDATAKQLAGVFFARFSEKVADPAFGESARDAVAEPKARVGAEPAGIGQVSGSAPLAPPPERAGAPSALWICASLAILLGGFILGRAAIGWDGSGILAGPAIGLLAMLSAWVGFLFGRQSPAIPQILVINPDMLAPSGANGRKTQP